MIRVTQSLLTQSLKRNLGQSISSLYRLQDQISTARRLLRPSDDAGDFAYALNMRDAVGVAGRYKKNGQETKDWLAVTETSVTSAGEMLQTIRTRVVQSANAPLSASERGDLAQEINQLLEEMLGTANADNAGRYVFAGHATLAAPFVATRSEEGQITSVTYRGDDGLMRREIMTDDVIPANITGREFFIKSAHTVRARAGANVFSDASKPLNDATQLNYIPPLTDGVISLNGQAFRVSPTMTVNELARLISEDPVANVTARVEDTPGGVVPPGQRLVFVSDKASQRISFDYVSAGEVATGFAAAGAVGGTIYVDDVKVTLAAGDMFADVATKINAALQARGITDVTADVQVSGGDSFLRIVGPPGRQVSVRDGTEALFATVSNPIYRSGDAAAYTATAGNTIAIEGRTITLTGGNISTVAADINAAGIQGVTATVVTVGPQEFLEITGPDGRPPYLQDGTEPLFATISTAGSPASLLERLGIVGSRNQVIGDQEGPYSIFETLIRLRDDLQAGDAPNLLPDCRVLGSGTIRGVVNTAGFISGQVTVTTDAAGRVAVDYTSVPPRKGIFFDRTYRQLPVTDDQQRQLDLLNRVVVQSTTYITDPNLALGDAAHVNPTPPPGWTASPAVGGFTVNGVSFAYDGTQSLRDLATTISGDPTANVTAAVLADGRLEIRGDDGNPVSIADTAPGGIMESLGLTEPGGLTTRAAELTRDSLSEFGIALQLSAPSAGTQVISFGPVIENHRAENLTDLGLTLRVSGGGIESVFGKPTDTRSGTHRLTMVGPLTYGTAVVSATGDPAVTVTGVASHTMQSGATISFDLDAAGLIVANSVRYVPGSNGGRPPTVDELAQLNALNAGGVAPTATSLSEFGITLAIGAGGGASGGTVSITIPPASATVQDEYFPSDGTASVISTDTIYAYSANNLRDCVPGATVIAGELVMNGQAIVTSTSRAREIDLDIAHQLNIDAQVGSRTARVEQNTRAIDRDLVSFNDLLSKTEDLDVPSALVDLQELENVYQSALAVGSRVILPTLMDFLK